MPTDSQNIRIGNSQPISLKILQQKYPTVPVEAWEQLVNRYDALNAGLNSYSENGQKVPIRMVNELESLKT